MSSLIAQFVKNSPVMREIPIRFLGWSDPLEKGEATTPVLLGFLCGSDGKEFDTLDLYSQDLILKNK